MEKGKIFVGIILFGSYAYMGNVNGFKRAIDGIVTHIAELFEPQVPSYILNSDKENESRMPSYSPSFTGKKSFLYDPKRKCPNKNTTFKCVDKGNNGIIVKTDKCLNCPHMYYVHKEVE